jgi:ribosomal protein L11 methyltransferase
VLANIAAPLLVERATELCAACRPGGDLVLAGILAVDAPAVVAAFAALADGPIDVRTDGEWAALLLRRAS